jgi:hypothetical protein
VQRAAAEARLQLLLKLLGTCMKLGLGCKRDDGPHVHSLDLKQDLG